MAGSPVSGTGQGSSSSPEETDDFVLVPSNIPSDVSSDSNHAERQWVVTTFIAYLHRTDKCVAVS